MNQIPFIVQALFIGGPIFCIVLYGISIHLVKKHHEKEYKEGVED
ncbi:hypothetical protein [Oceanobacillus sojae]|nr:hypothetical protein [Oceanobacillus sojae]